MSELLQTAVPVGDGAREEAVGVVSGGRTLRGNLVLAGCDHPAVLFLHGWAGNRGGPHQLLTAAARALARDGISSLRFDFSGRGESDGDSGAATLEMMAGDALAAAACLRARSGARELVLSGICSGGNVAIGVADRLPEAAGLFLMSVYPFSAGDSFGRRAHRTAHFAAEYWRKLWRRETWRKVWRGAVDVRQVAKVLFGHYRGRPAQRLEREEGPGEGPLANLRREGLRICMAYGDADPDFAASHAYYRDFAERHGVAVDWMICPGANHNFYSLTWKRALIDRLRRFVTGRT